ncbi:glutamate-1-semialdehyde 2,1-aminomutase [Aquihabitans sp. G128]|uniref:glutamate-1-semialdehyde 2,1-aminomutase n=1 Tax=Aquihabitans sp. G128 TaxID=2849779 RepID=UPI0020B44AD9|nr:glutamate-1-semialdehyde 2,1-aminomutase [Aquihabitans sp. G128]
MTTNSELFERAQRVIPGGVNSPVRAFGSVGGTPYFVARAEGARVWDVEGTEYLDLVQSYGAIIGGHAHPKVIEAIRSAALDGTSYGAPTEREVLVAEAVSERVPSCEKVRMVSSGTEATMTALRLARGATGRTKVVKFAGNYHGHGDALLAESGSAVAHLDPVHSPDGVPGSAGVPPTAVAETLVVPYNQVPTLDDTVACVIVEPIAANMGLVAPVPGFLAGLRTECDRVGALLIFDEVITGFRVARGGAQATFEVRPDLTCFGKVIGGGLNVGAFGGRADLMDLLAPLGPVYQAGTLSGNPLATAAGLAALDLLDDGAYEQLTGTAARLADGLAQALQGAGLTVQVPRAGTLVGLFFGTELPVDYAGARGTDEAAYAALFHALLSRGVALAPGAYEVLFPGLAHTDAVVDEIVERAGAAAIAVAGAG